LTGQWAYTGELMKIWRSLAAVVVLVGVAGWFSAASAVGPDYRVGTDDILAVSVWDQKDLDQVVSVRPDGKISLPLVGEVEAGGLTVAELASRLTALYGRTVRGAQVTVSVREIRSRPVFFLGGVVRPGPMQLTQELTLLQALSAVGGTLPTADLEGVFVQRGKQRIPANLLTMLQKGDMAQNVTLEPGDTVVVPTADAVYVQGEVKTPGQVRYSRGMTVVQAIAAAGGFTQLASSKRVTVIRDDGAKKEVLRVNVGDLMSDPGSKDVPLKPNDVINVPQRLF
jgi:polysaccharide biosynthesis/export protein